MRKINGLRFLDLRIVSEVFMDTACIHIYVCKGLCGCKFRLQYGPSNMHTQLRRSSGGSIGITTTSSRNVLAQIRLALV